MPEEKDPAKSLSEVACKYGDQTIQKAAIAGLIKLATPQAMLGIASRMLDSWGVETLKYCIKSLNKVADKGGTLLLSSTLPIDYRFFNEKLEILAEIEGEQEWVSDLHELFNKQEEVNNHYIISILEKAKNSDISEGVIFGSQYVIPNLNQIKFAPYAITVERFIKARNYVESRLPELPHMFEAKLEANSGLTESNVSFFPKRTLH